MNNIPQIKQMKIYVVCNLPNYQIIANGFHLVNCRKMGQKG